MRVVAAVPDESGLASTSQAGGAEPAGPGPCGGPQGAVFRHDICAVLLLGLVLGLACRGYYAMPYTDFAEFVDCGHAWLSGELPPTLKRGPVYPVLVVGLAKLMPGEAPELHVAEWLNALLLPLNALLVYLVGRRWFGAGARWAAVWVLLLPMGLYCTAHVVVAPLLTGLILLTILLAQRGSGWAYVAAAVATMTRYDAAGLIVGLALAEWLAGRSVRWVVLGAFLDAVPLIVLLIFTALIWPQGSTDHYLASIVTRPTFEPQAMATLIAQTAFEPHLLHFPAWLSELGPALNSALYYGPLILAVVGAAVLLRARDPGMLTALVALVGYWFVHAVFPMQIDRFGYPPAPLVVLLAGAGLHAVVVWFKRLGPPTVVLRIGMAVVAAVVLAGLIAEAQALAVVAAGAGRFAAGVGWLGLVALVVVWAAPLMYRRRLAQVVLLLAVVLLATVQLARASAKLGTGREMRNVVAAARWIREYTPADERVLSSQPGLLRLFTGRTPPDRFVGFADIRADDWAGILAECRQRHITHILWHDGLAAMHGGYYADQMRLSRFDGLADAEALAGVEVERRFVGQPNVVIVRVLPE